MPKASKVVKKYIMENRENFILSNTVAFIGLMGAGKTTLGRHFAKTIHVDFVDSDEEIVQRAGISIPEIFDASKTPLTN